MVNSSPMYFNGSNYNDVVSQQQALRSQFASPTISTNSFAAPMPVAAPPMCTSPSIVPYPVPVSDPTMVSQGVSFHSHHYPADDSNGTNKILGVVGVVAGLAALGTGAFFLGKHGNLEKAGKAVKEAASEGVSKIKKLFPSTEEHHFGTFFTKKEREEYKAALEKASQYAGDIDAPLASTHANQTIHEMQEKVHLRARRRYYDQEILKHLDPKTEGKDYAKLMQDLETARVEGDVTKIKAAAKALNTKREIHLPKIVQDLKLSEKLPYTITKGQEEAAAQFWWQLNRLDEMMKAHPEARPYLMAEVNRLESELNKLKVAAP